MWESVVWQIVGPVIASVDDDSIALIKQTAVVGCDAIGHFTSGIDERLPSHAKCHVRLIVKRVPVEDDFGNIFFFTNRVDLIF